MRDGIFLDRDAEQLADRRTSTATLSALNVCRWRMSLRKPNLHCGRATTPGANFRVGRTHHSKATAAFSKSPVIEEESPAAEAPPRNGVADRGEDLTSSPETVANRSTSRWAMSPYPTVIVPLSQF